MSNSGAAMEDISPHHGTRPTEVLYAVALTDLEATKGHGHPEIVRGD